VLVVGVGRVDADELRMIATHPDEDVFEVDDFDALVQINTEIADAVCFAGRDT